MVIANLAGEKQPRDKGKHWIAQVTVQRRHSARLYPPLETVPHHQVIALPQLLYERRQMQEVVAVVCVPHDDIFPKGAVTAPNQGCAVSLLWHMHDPCPFLFGNLLGAVGTSVVRNYNFPIHAAFRQEFLGFADTYGQCLCLVKARH